MSIEKQEFVSAFLASHRRLYAYLVTLTPTLDDAEEVFQKTSLVLWKRWEEFDTEREFFPWACGVARIQARNHLSKTGRSPLSLGDQAAELVAQAVLESGAEVDRRLEILKGCLQKLSSSQQTLLKRCYEENGLSIQNIADELNITPNSLYQRLKRLREQLHACVDRFLLAGGAS